MTPQEKRTLASDKRVMATRMLNDAVRLEREAEIDERELREKRCADDGRLDS